MDKVYHFFLVGIFLGIVGIIAGEDVIHGDEAVSEQKKHEAKTSSLNNCALLCGNLLLSGPVH